MVASGQAALLDEPAELDERRPPIERLARLARRRRRSVLVVAGLIVALAAGLAADLPKRILPGGEPSDSSQSARLLEATSHASVPSLFAVIHREDGSPVSAAQVAAVTHALDGERDVAEVRPLPKSATTPQTRVLQVVSDVYGDQNMKVAHRLAADRSRIAPAGTTVSIGGFNAYRDDVTQEGFADLRRAETIGIPIVLLVLFLTFGSVWGALIPLLVALCAVVVGLGAVDVIGRFTPLSEYVENAASMIGVALGVDYAMFVVQRVREEAARGLDVEAAVDRAMATTGTAVAWSGLTVLLAEAALFLVDSRAVHSIAYGLVLVTACAVAVNVLVLPALLDLLGPRILRTFWAGRGSDRSQRGWARWADVVTRRPAAWALAAVVVLLALAAPALHLSRHVEAGSAADGLTRHSQVRQAYLQSAAAYGAGVASPVLVLVDSSNPGAVQRAAGELRSDPRIDSVTQTPAGQSHALLSVVARAAPYTPAAYRLVADLRGGGLGESLAPLHPLVGGESAAATDFRATDYGELWKVFAVLLPVIALIFLGALRSLLLPLKAVALVVLSLAATFGALILLTTTAVGASLVGQDGPLPINPVDPLVIVSIVVALATDYEVILIGRMREYFDAGGDNTTAVRDGLAHTGRVITSAATIMVVVFATFATADVIAVKQVGLGLAVAVFLDATVVRAVLVPAVMTLMGRWNWWIPRRL